MSTLFCADTDTLVITAQRNNKHLKIFIGFIFSIFFPG